MKRAVASGALALMLLSCATSATAGVYTDDLSKCLVKSSTTADRALLMKWIFAMLALNPAVSSVSNVQSSDRQTYSKSAALLMQRLMLSDCHTEAVEAVKYEGSGAIEAGFSTLGEVASRDLMTDPKVAAGLGDLQNYMDTDKWEAFGKEAGLRGEGAAKGAPQK